MISKLTRNDCQAVNPKIELKNGQSAVLTCIVHAANVDRKNINWYKDGERVREGISRDRFSLDSYFEILSFISSSNMVTVELKE